MEAPVAQCGWGFFVGGVDRTRLPVYASGHPILTSGAFSLRHRQLGIHRCSTNSATRRAGCVGTRRSTSFSTHTGPAHSAGPHRPAWNLSPWSERQATSRRPMVSKCRTIHSPCSCISASRRAVGEARSLSTGAIARATGGANSQAIYAWNSGEYATKRTSRPLHSLSVGASQRSLASSKMSAGTSIEKVEPRSKLRRSTRSRRRSRGASTT